MFLMILFIWTIKISKNKEANQAILAQGKLPLYSMGILPTFDDCKAETQNLPREFNQSKKCGDQEMSFYFTSSLSFLSV